MNGKWQLVRTRILLIGHPLSGANAITADATRQPRHDARGGGSVLDTSMTPAPIHLRRFPKLDPQRWLHMRTLEFRVHVALFRLALGMYTSRTLRLLGSLFFTELSLNFSTPISGEIKRKAKETSARMRSAVTFSIP